MFLNKKIYINFQLEQIIKQKNFEFASHKAIEKLINFKFGLHFWWFWGKFILDILFCVVWNLWAVLIPYDQKYLYNFPQDWWRIFLFVFLMF